MLLVFALLIQNTCPRGFAGKSAVTASCSHCPHKQVYQPALEGGMFSIASHPAAPMPTYVLDIPNTQPTFRLVAVASPQLVMTNTYKNAAPDELLQPPRA